MTNELRKTAFYQISISDSSGQNFIPIPYPVHRLIEKVEIKELFGTGWCTPGQFTVYFLEGSREPYPTNKEVDTSTSYPLVAPGSGLLTNNVGMLADLRYTNNGGEGITAITPDSNGIIANSSAGASGTFQGTFVGGSVNVNQPSSVINLEESSKNAAKLISIDSDTPKNKPIKYLFQQRNRMKITWGYVEDLESHRSVIGSIAGIDLEFPENDHPKVKVISVETALHFDQVSGIFGASFFNSSVQGSTVFGEPIQTFENLTVKDIIESFSSKANMGKPIVSAIFSNIRLDKYAFNIIPAGMSPNQFFGELSKKYNAYYKVAIDPKTNQDTIVFLDKKEYNSKLLSNDVVLLTYKNPGSIIKSVSIKAEYTALSGSAKGYVDETGEIAAIATKSSIPIGMIEAGADLADSDPTGNNPVTAAKGTIAAFNTPYTVGTVEYSPEGNDPETVKRQVSGKAYCANENTIMINLNTIGYTKLRPGAWYISGLGKRFSATYYFKEVSHTIDAAGGYVCTMSGSTNSDLGGTGKSADGETQTQKPQPQVTTPLTNPGSFDSAASTASDEFSISQV